MQLLELLLALIGVAPASGQASKPSPGLPSNAAKSDHHSSGDLVQRKQNGSAKRPEDLQTQTATQSNANEGTPARATAPWTANGVDVHEETGMGPYKAELNACMDRLGITDTAQRRLVVAMAMMEGKSQADRDKSKDGTNSANGPLNINAFILQLGGENDKFEHLASRMPSMSLAQAISYVKQARECVGTEGLLRAQRGGETTYLDGKSYGFATYAKNIAATLRRLEAEPSALTDDRRFWTNTPNVKDGDRAPG